MSWRRVAFVLMLPVLLTQSTDSLFAADSTAFDPTKVQVTAKATSSIPVGTVISWPVATDPADMQNPDGTYNWLECNGQSVSQTVYPELFAVIGGKTPDYRSWFLRGGTAGQAGDEAQDSIRSHAHELTEHAHTLSIKDAASKDDVASMTPIYDTVTVGGISGVPMVQLSCELGNFFTKVQYIGVYYESPAYGLNNEHLVGTYYNPTVLSKALACGFPFTLYFHGPTSGVGSSQVDFGSLSIKKENEEYTLIKNSRTYAVCSAKLKTQSSGSSSITYVSGMKMAPGSSAVNGTTDPGGAGQTRETGDAETAPKHKFVRYLIRARP